MIFTKSWTLTLVAGWAAIWAASEVQFHFPAKYWLDAGDVTVASGPGDCPAMTFSRDLNRPFRANWVVTILRKQSAGFASFRTYEGGNDYRPGTALPDDLNLCWWTWQDNLALPRGEYMVNTLWSIELANGTSKEVRRTSNVFEVTE